MTLFESLDEYREPVDSCGHYSFHTDTEKVVGVVPDIVCDGCGAHYFYDELASKYRKELST